MDYLINNKLNMNKIDYWVFNSFKEFEKYFLEKYPPNINDWNIKYHLWYNSQEEIDQYKKNWITPINISIFFRRLQMINEEWNTLYNKLDNELNSKLIDELKLQREYYNSSAVSLKRFKYNYFKESELKIELEKSRDNIKKSLDSIVHIKWLNDFLKHYWYSICI